MRVVVADDTMLTREGIVRLLEDAGVDVVAQAEDGEGLLRHVRLARPDAAIVDIRMPPTHTDEGLVAAQAIRAEHPDIGVLVLSQYVEANYALRLLEEHPERIGYLLKERVFDVAILLDALRRIADGETVIDPTIVSQLFGRRRREDPLAELTDREREVLSTRRRGPLEQGNRPTSLHHRAHCRGAREADFPQAGSGYGSGVAPARAGRARVSAGERLTTISELHEKADRVLTKPVAGARPPPRLRVDGSFQRLARGRPVIRRVTRAHHLRPHATTAT